MAPEIVTKLSAQDQMSPIFARVRREMDAMAAAAKRMPMVSIPVDAGKVATAQDRIRELERTLASWQRVAARGGTITVGDLSQIRAAETELAKLKVGLSSLSATQATAALTNTGNAAVTTAQRLATLGSSLSSLGLKLSLGLTAPLLLIGKNAIQAASDAAESANKMQVVFGGAADVIEDLGKTSARSLGLSSRNAMEAAGTFGNLFKVIGLADRENAQMSASLVKLAADLASFNNIDPSLALEKLRAGLVGEAEPLRQLGVLLTEQRVAQEAVRLGYARTTSQVSESAKVQARYSLILQQTKTAQGDFARTSDGLANSTRIAQAAMQDAAATMGEALIPLAINLAGKVTDLATAFGDMSPEAQNATIAVAGLAAAAGPLSSILGIIAKIAPVIIGFLGSIAGVAAGAAAAVGLVTAGVMQLSAQATERTLTDEEADKIIGVPSRAQIEARLANTQEFIAIAKENIAQDMRAGRPVDEASLLQLSNLEAEAAGLQRTLDGLAVSAQRGVHAVDPLAGAAAAGAAGANALTAAYTRAGAILDKLTGGANTGEALQKAIDDIGNAAMLGPLSDAQMEKWRLLLELLALNNAEAVALKDNIAAVGTIVDTPAAVMQRDYGVSQDYIGPTQLEANKAAADRRIAAIDAANKATETGIKNTQSAAEKALSAIEAKFRQLATAVTSAIDDARKKAAGLFDLGGGGGGGGGIETTPGKGGPFEALYRILAVASRDAGRGTTPDTERFAAMYGPGLAAAGTTATEASRQFQAGNLLAPGVFENIDWTMLGQQAMAAQEGSKISTYAGEAAAALLSSGQALTPENMKAMIDELAAKDQQSTGPKLDTIATLLAQTDTKQHTDLVNVLAAVNEVAAKLPGSKPTAPPTTTETTQPPPKGPPPQTVPIFAAGTTSAPGGWALVGEQGPELVRLPQGSRVYGAGETRQMSQPIQGGGGQEAAQFVTALVRSVGVKARDMNEAAAGLADMLVAAAAGQVQQGLARQLSRSR